MWNQNFIFLFSLQHQQKPRFHNLLSEFLSICSKSRNGIRLELSDTIHRRNRIGRYGLLTGKKVFSHFFPLYRYILASVPKCEIVAWILQREANLSDELSNHAVPGPVWERRAVLSISHLVDVVLEAQDLSESIQDVDGEALVPLGLTQDVLRHHHKRFLLSESNRRPSLY